MVKVLMLWVGIVVESHGLHYESVTKMLNSLMWYNPDDAVKSLQIAIPRKTLSSGLIVMPLQKKLHKVCTSKTPTRGMK